VVEICEHTVALPISLFDRMQVQHSHNYFETAVSGVNFNLVNKIEIQQQFHKNIISLVSIQQQSTGDTNDPDLVNKYKDIKTK